MLFALEGSPAGLVDYSFLNVIVVGCEIECTYKL